VLVLTCGGGVVAGICSHACTCGLLPPCGRSHLHPAAFISTFAVWILADRIGLSAIITVVCYAMTLARHVPARIDARRRIASYAVWEVMVSC